MTSPFVDRVEYQVIGRDVNASGVFRDVADAADSAGNSLNGLGSDLDRVNRSIDDTASRMQELLASLQDLSATRQITVTTNVQEVLGSVEDNRQVLDLLNDRFENLTINVVATVNQLVQLNDGLTTIDDNRTAVITLGDDVLQLTQNIDATVDSVVNLNDGIQTIDDNRNVIVTVDDDFRTLTQNIDATVNSVVQLNDGITTVDDNRGAITRVGDDFRTVGDDIDNTRTVIIRFNDEVANVDDNRNRITDLGNGFDDLSTAIERSRGRVTDLNNDLNNLPGGQDINNQIDTTRRTVETVASDRDRWERAGLVAGGAFLSKFLDKVSNGLDNIPIIGPMLANMTRSLAALSAPFTAAVLVILAAVTASAAVVVANAFTAGILGALGGGVLAVGFLAAFSDPYFKLVLKGVGIQIKETFTDAVKDSGFATELAKQLQTVIDGFKALKPIMTDVFTNAAPLIKPLVDGMMGFIQNVLPGLSIALKNMKPIFDQLGVWLPKLGKTVGEFFAKLSTTAPEAASALGYVLGFLDTAIKFTGGLLIGLSKLEPYAERALQVVKRFFDFVYTFKPGFAIITFLQDLWYLLGLLRDLFDIVRPLWESFGSTVETLTNQLGRLLGPLNRLLGPLSRLPGLGGNATGALGDFGTSADTAGSKADTFTGKVKTLTDKLFGVPDADPKVTAHDFASPIVRGITAGLNTLDHKTAVPTVVVDDNTEATLNRVKGALDRLNGKTVKVYVQGVQTGTTLYHGYSLGGAVFGSGPKGVDSKLAMLAPGEHVLTAREVEAAGGQEAVYALRRSLLGHTGLGGSGVSATQVGRRPSGGMDTNGFAAALRTALSGMTLVIDDRTGRTAQLIARGG